MRNSIYNNIKGVIKILCGFALLVSFACCSAGTDEELISYGGQHGDSALMNIRPTGYYFVMDASEAKTIADDALMLVVIDRPIKSWRAGYLQTFASDPSKVSINSGHYLNPNDSSLVTGDYNFLACSYDQDSFDYSDIEKYLNRESDSTIYDLNIRYNPSFDGVLSESKRLYSAFIPNFYLYSVHGRRQLENMSGMPVLDESGNPMYQEAYIQFYTKYLTQHFEWTFYINKTDESTVIDAVSVEIDGVPHAVNPYSGVVDASKVYPIRADVRLGRSKTKSKPDTVYVSADAFTIVRPEHKNAIKLKDSSQRLGYMDVYLQIRDKNRPSIIRHPLYELEESGAIDAYTLEKDSFHLKVQGGARYKMKVADKLLINKDTVKAHIYRDWTVIQN